MDNYYSDFKSLTELATELGAAEAAIIPTQRIPIEDGLAEICRPPGCEFYGLSAQCPPNVSGPDGFREMMKEYDHTLVFKIEVPSEDLLSSKRIELFRMLHYIAAEIEQSAVRLRYSNPEPSPADPAKPCFVTSTSNARY